MHSYLNSKFVKNPKVSVFDRGFMYGDGAFESLRTYSGKPFLLNDHLKRLSSTCKFLKIKVKFPNIPKLIIKLMKANNLKEAYIKIFVTRGEAAGHGLSIKRTKGKPLLLITVEKLNPRPKICKAVIYRIPRSVWPGSRMKTLNYLENILARMYAESKGADEAIFIDSNGNVLEGTTSNIFILKNKTLITAPISAPLLAGVTRNYIINLARKNKIKVKERLFKVKELLNADKAFITSSGIGMIPMEVYDAKV